MYLVTGLEEISFLFLMGGKELEEEGEVEEGDEELEGMKVDADSESH